MRRVLSTLGWVVGAVAMLAVFIAAGRWSTTPVRWDDLGGWLNEVPPEEGVVELVRWAGMALAGYVAVVSVLVLLSEVAAAARWVSLATLLRRAGLRSAIPRLRRRLVHATATTAMTVSSLAATAGASVGASAPPAPLVQMVDAVATPAPLPAGVLPEQVNGFGVTASPASTLSADQALVARGDTLWDMTVARFGHADAALIDTVADLSGLSDPSLIYEGQVITFPATAPPAPGASLPPPDVPAGTATWGVHRVVAGDTLWDVLDRHYGYVDGDLVWFVADHNSLADPSDIPIGADITLPPLPGTADSGGPVPAVVEPAPSAPELAAPIPTVPTDLPATPVDAPPAPKPASLPPPLPPPSSVAVVDREPVPPLSLVPALSADAHVVSGADSTTPVLPWVLGATGSVVLATGLVEFFRRRRRARWAVRSSAWRIGAASEEPVPAVIAEIADLSLVEWAAASLGRLVADTPDAVVVSVELDDATLSVRWDRQRVVAASPWWSTDGGWVWNLSRSAWLPPHEDDPPVALAGLVTLGERNGRQYLVNLAAVGSVSVDGPLVEEFVASIVLELATGELLSSAAVQLVRMQLVGVEQLPRLTVVSSDEAITGHNVEAGAAFVVSVVESDDPSAAALVDRAAPGSVCAVIVLGRSSLQTAVEISLFSSGSGEQQPAGVSFTACRVPGVLVTVDSPSSSVAEDPMEDPGGDDPQEATPINVVALDDRRRDLLEAPRVLLRLFSARLPVLEPAPLGLDARQMRIVAVLDSFGAGRAPARLAERLGVSLKTVQNQVTPLRSMVPPLVHSDGEIWTLDSGVCSDVEWMHDLATSARESPSRQVANRALNECWELFSRVTGPAYAGGAESNQWAWVNERDDGTSPVEMATHTLVEAVAIATETWEKLAVSGIEELRSASSIVQIILRLERAVALAEPWRLFGAALKVARRGPDSARQQIAMRLAQLAHDGQLEVPETLVAAVVP